MEREEKYLLHLLGVFLRGEKPESEDALDWDKLVQLAYIHSIVGILGYMTMTYPICPDPHRAAALRRLCLNTILQFAQRGELMEQLGRELNAWGIEHIVMKGYVLRECYPVPELRTFGDIDLVIHPEDREACDTLMRELGYRVKADWEPVYSYIRNEEFYEIHTEIMEVDVSEKAGCRAYFRTMWDHTVPAGGCCRRFKPEFHFLYMLTHIAKHVTGSGAGLRMYLDVAAFVRHSGTALDWQHVRRELVELGLENFANVVLTLVRDCFGVESPIPLTAVDAEVMEAFLEFTVKGGVFGKTARDSGTVSLKNQSREEGETSRTATLVRRLFPTVQSIQTRYTYLQDKPWLLPAAWIHRLIKTKSAWRAHAEEAQSILTADKSEVQKLTDLYKEIGL